MITNAVTKVQPALYTFTKLPWAWVKLGEVASIVGLPIEDVWPTYKRLSLNQQEINVAWENDQEEEFEHGSFMHEVDLAKLPLEKLHYIFVPAGWGIAICKANQQ